MSACLEEQVLAQVLRLKEGPVTSESRVPVLQNGRLAAWLEAVTRQDVDTPESITLLANWREAAADAFPARFPVTLAGTRRWLVNQLLDVPDRLLFWVKDLAGARVGHVGLFHFDFAGRHVEIDNIVRGLQGVHPGLMHASVQALLDWSFLSLGMETIFLRVFSDNARAIRLYEHCGFNEVVRVPLARVDEGEVTRWVEATGVNRGEARRYFVTMRLPRSQWVTRGHESAAA